MLKVRLMRTKNNIKWFVKILWRNPKIGVTEFSALFQNKVTKKYYRAYVEVLPISALVCDDVQLLFNLKSVQVLSWIK